jgi:hypothetical protein
MGVEVVQKGRNQIEGARGEGTLRETMMEVAEKRLVYPNTSPHGLPEISLISLPVVSNPRVRV